MINSQNITFCKTCKIAFDRSENCPGCQTSGESASGGVLSITRKNREMLIIENNGKLMSIWVTHIKGGQVRIGISGDGFNVTRAEIYNTKKAESYGVKS